MTGEQKVLYRFTFDATLNQELEMQRNIADPESTSTASEIEADSPESPTRRSALRTGLTVLSALAAGGFVKGAGAQSSTGHPHLLLKDPQLAGKVNKLFEDLSKDKKVQKEFIENPTSMVMTRFLPHQKKPSAQRISNANRALFSALSNEEFRKFVQTYDQVLAKKKTLDSNQILADVATAMAKHADPGFFRGLLEEQAARVSVTNHEGDDVVFFVCAIVAVCAGILIIPVIAPIDLQIHQNFAASISARDLRSVAEQLTAQADKLRASGKLTGKIIDVKLESISAHT